MRLTEEGIHLYHKNNFECSKRTMYNYSTSFSMGAAFLHKSVRPSIFAIYGYVRYADEIVDTFFDYPQQELLDRFRDETFRAIQQKISINPIIDSFQQVVNCYGIENHLIESFLQSMEMDLDQKEHDAESFDRYIYGSAEVVGLMCLKVFVNGNEESYNRLKGPARDLGRAFQKVNFLRDIKSDYKGRGRVYFPEIEFERMTKEQKREIIRDIQRDFKNAYAGLKELDRKSGKQGVKLAYMYYSHLLKKIEKAPVQQLLAKRIRIPNWWKLILLMKSYTFA